MAAQPDGLLLPSVHSRGFLGNVGTSLGITHGNRASVPCRAVRAVVHRSGHAPTRSRLTVSGLCRSGRWPCRRPCSSKGALCSVSDGADVPRVNAILRVFRMGRGRPGFQTQDPGGFVASCAKAARRLGTDGATPPAAWAPRAGYGGARLGGVLPSRRAETNAPRLSWPTYVPSTTGGTYGRH